MTETFLARSARYSSPFSPRSAGLARFAVQALAAAASPPYFPRLILRQMLDIGYFSLPVVGLTAIFTGMVLALQSYTGFSRFNAESAVATVVVLSVTRELGPVIAGADGRRPGRRRDGGRDRHDARHRADRRADDAVDRPAALSGAAAPDRRAHHPAGAGAGRRHHRRVRRLSRRRLQARASTRSPT